MEGEFTANARGVTPASQKLNEFQVWINANSPVHLNVRSTGERAINDISSADLQRYSGRAVSIAQSLVMAVIFLSFVVVTGWSHAADHVSPAAGISHHLVKPVDPDALKSILVRFASPEAAGLLTR